MIILPFTKSVAEKSAEVYHNLRQRNKMIEFRDIFIGATALAHGLTGIFDIRLSPIK